MVKLTPYNSKMVIIKSRGLVHTSRGLVRGPMRSAYREHIDRIWSMITEDRADVFEVLRNGTEVKLTPQNYDQDNNIKEPIEANKFVEPDNKRPVEPEPKPEPVVTDAIHNDEPVTKPTNFSEKKKKNKGNKPSVTIEAVKPDDNKKVESAPIVEKPVIEEVKDNAPQNIDDLDEATLEAMTAPEKKDNLEVSPEEV